MSSNGKSDRDHRPEKLNAAQKALIERNIALQFSRGQITQNLAAQLAANAGHKAFSDEIVAHGVPTYDTVKAETADIMAAATWPAYKKPAADDAEAQLMRALTSEANRRAVP